MIGCAIQVLVVLAVIIVLAGLWSAHPSIPYWFHELGLLAHAIGSWWNSGPAHGRAPSPSPRP